jgi:hypothetical protein
LGPLDGFNVEPLTDDHDRGRFSCGPEPWKEPLNRYLRETAIKQDRNDTTRVHVYANAAQIAGYYTLSPLMLDLAEIPVAMQRGRPSRLGVGATLLGKLAVDERFQHCHVGEFLLSDAIRGALAARKHVSSVMLIIDSKPEALAWYMKQDIGLASMPAAPHKLYLPFNQIPVSP